MELAVFILFFVTIFFAGYAIGEHRGWVDGFASAKRVLTPAIPMLDHLIKKEFKDETRR
jgi:hypothetical protein